MKGKRKTKRKIYAMPEVPPDPLPRSGLPVAVDNPWKSLGRGCDPHCHQWQRGHHIDTLARD